MNIVFVGDSFCYGAELSKLTDRYSDLIQSELQCSIINLGEVGCSNQKIITTAYDCIQNNNVDFCFVGLTYSQRFSLPYENKIRNWNGKPVKDSNDRRYLIAKYIYSSNTDETIWDRYNYPFIQMFKDACDLKGVTVIFHSNDQNVRKRYSAIGVDILPLSFEEINDMNNLKLGRFGHPLEEAHAKYAEYLMENIR